MSKFKHLVAECDVQLHVDEKRGTWKAKVSRDSQSRVVKGSVREWQARRLGKGPSCPPYSGQRSIACDAYFEAQPFLNHGVGVRRKRR
jgi:hypothetical protein